MQLPPYRVPNSAALRVGVIGCGFFAVNQVRAWASFSDVFIAALCDCHSERADRLASELQLDVPTFADAAEMADKVALDFLDIITTPATHPALVALAANRKVPAVVQKPMALSLEEAKTMVEMMEAAHLPLMVHENYRFQVPIAAVGEVVRSDEIGQPVYAHIASRTAHDIYTGQPYLAAEKRLILADVGVHILDVARFLLGEAERVYCETQRVRPGLSGEDMATVLLRHTCGAISVVECSYASALPEENFPQTLIVVEGSSGSVRLGSGYQIVVRSRDVVRQFDASPASPPWAVPPWHVVQDSVRRTQKHWIECIRAGIEPQTSGRDNLNTLALMEAAYDSAASGASVRPEVNTFSS